MSLKFKWKYDALGIDRLIWIIRLLAQRIEPSVNIFMLMTLLLICFDKVYFLKYSSGQCCVSIRAPSTIAVGVPRMSLIQLACYLWHEGCFPVKLVQMNIFKNKIPSSTDLKTEPLVHLYPVNTHYTLI